MFSIRRSVVAGLMVAAFAGNAFAFSDAYQGGVAAASEYRYELALNHFLLASDVGDPNGMREAGMMLLYGESVYGPEIKQDKSRGLMLLSEAARSGCEISKYVVSQNQEVQRVGWPLKLKSLFFTVKYPTQIH